MEYCPHEDVKLRTEGNKVFWYCIDCKKKDFTPNEIIALLARIKAVSSPSK